MVCFWCLWKAKYQKDFSELSKINFTGRNTKENKKTNIENFLNKMIRQYEREKEENPSKKSRNSDQD